MLGLNCDMFLMVFLCVRFFHTGLSREINGAGNSAI